jgi:hypothetical protein
MIRESEILNYSSCTPNKIRCPKTKGYDVQPFASGA